MRDSSGGDSFIHNSEVQYINSLDRSTIKNFKIYAPEKNSFRGGMAVKE